MEPTPSPPERRIPGWKLVLVLVVIGVLVLIPALFLQFTRFGPPLLLIRITDGIRATPGNGTVAADLGPHCSPILWDASTRELTATTEVNLANVAGLLLQRLDLLSQNFFTTPALAAGGDLIRSTLAVDGSAWTLTSPVDDRVLATFVLSGENVTVNGSSYGPGDSWPLSFAYNVTTPGGTFRIEESLTLTNEGIVRPRIVLPGACA